VLGDGPVAYWRLGERSGTTGVDASGNGHSGTYSSGVSLGVPGALVGDMDTAVNFGSGALSVPDASALRLNGPFTIELWAKQGTFVGSWPGLLAKGQSWTAGSGYEMYETSDGAVHFKDDAKDGFSTGPGALVTTGYSDLVVTYDGANVRWYVNGVLKTTQAATFTANTNISPLTVGQGPNPANNTLDEVAFYSKALTATQITNHYKAATS
jgi:hypothetical protein